MRNRVTLILLVVCGRLLAAEAIPVGASQTEMTAGGRPIRVFTYKPAAYRDGPLIVVFHGMNRNADTYRDNARGMGDRFGALIAAPEFDAQRFPAVAYQRGGIVKDGRLQPQASWTCSLVPGIVKAIREREGRARMPCYLIGHSAGGQFLARLAGFMETDAVRIVAANPGSHLFPTREMPFQYGFGGLPDAVSNDAALRRYLAQPLTLFLGAADTGDASLDKSETAMKQGATRIERGRNCFRAAEQLAQEKGWPFHWRLVEAPGIGHDSKAMFNHPRCEEALFGASRRATEGEGTPPN